MYYGRIFSVMAGISQGIDKVMKPIGRAIQSMQTESVDVPAPSQSAFVPEVDVTPDRTLSVVQGGKSRTGDNPKWPKRIVKREISKDSPVLRWVQQGLTQSPQAKLVKLEQDLQATYERYEAIFDMSGEIDGRDILTHLALFAETVQMLVQHNRVTAEFVKSSPMPLQAYTNGSQHLIVYLQIVSEAFSESPMYVLSDQPSTFKMAQIHLTHLRSELINLSKETDNEAVQSWVARILRQFDVEESQI